MNGWFEKRRHHRLTVALPMLYQRVNRDNNPDQRLKGITQNISMGGLYFICLDWEDLDLNQVLDIAIEMPHQGFDVAGAGQLRTRAQILRIEDLPRRSHARGIALQFLEDLRFTNL